jgi:hypothetical protein
VGRAILLPALITIRRIRLVRLGRRNLAQHQRLLSHHCLRTHLSHQRADDGLEKLPWPSGGLDGLRDVRGRFQRTRGAFQSRPSRDTLWALSSVAIEVDRAIERRRFRKNPEPSVAETFTERN